MRRTAMPIRAVLFDVGGPLNTEVLHEAAWDRQIREALLRYGIAVSEAQLAAASEKAVAAFAPHTYQAIIWTLTEGHPDARAALAGRSFPGDHTLQLRDGIADTLARLQARGLLLGLAANQPADVIARLDAVGVGHYFTHREVSGTHGYHKPDVRLFLRACEDLEVVPQECVMVGDRIDNDIVPARMLGMRTVLFRTGRHIAQQPRAHDEVPDVEVRSAEELERALDALIRPD
jgi:FMN phosphatase YigB (HAD superfamily)